MSASLIVSEEVAPLMNINTTPLIDVMLVLLIMLMLALPMSTHQVSIDSPRSGPAVQREAVAIDIDFDNTVYWNGGRVADLAVLEDYFRSSSFQRAQPDVRIDADRRAKYAIVAQVMATAQRNGAQHLGLAGTDKFVE